MAQEDYYYEIQLTNKQLVFYFLAGAAGLILAFLAGVMVGRGVDSAGEVAASEPAAAERIVTEEPRALAPEELEYSKRLEQDRPRAELTPVQTARATSAPPPVTTTARARPTPPPTTQRAQPTPTPRPVAAATPTPPPATTPAPPATAPRTTPAQAPVYSIQVGAFKDRAAADKVVAQLKVKGFTAFVVAPDAAAGLYNVRVGRFAARADAERVRNQLRDEEKFKPFIVTQ